MVPFFSKTRNYQNNKISPKKKTDESSWCHQMCMNGKVNQGPLFDISVWCNRSLKTKLHLPIVRQYSQISHLKVVYVIIFHIYVRCLGQTTWLKVDLLCLFVQCFVSLDFYLITYCYPVSTTFQKITFRSILVKSNWFYPLKKNVFQLNRKKYTWFQC